MSEANGPRSDGLTGAYARRERLLEAFEDAWRRGQRPAVEDFLPDGAAEPELLLDLLQADLEYRLKAGESARAEDYLGRFPQVARRPEFVLDLIGREYCLRRAREPGLGAGEYAARFPHLRDQLPRHLPPVEGAVPRAEEPAEAGSGEPDTSLPGPSALAGTGEDLGRKRPSPEAPWVYPAIAGFEVLGLLGRGGMGVVYQARQVQLNRLVALKMIRAGEHAGPEDLARFRAEAEAVARLQHPHIVQIFEVGEHAGLPFFALEYLEGGSLQHRLQGSPLPAREAAQLVQTLARAIHAAHQRGIIHRDLKPANVLLDQDGRPKITDFGLAKRVEGGAGLTQSGVVMGTPSYMAPEQARGRGKAVGPAADVYALGAVLYECLTGRPPFKAATPLDTMLQVRSDEPVPPRRLQPKTPPDLETICLKALQKEPGKRYASATALADDLKRFLSGEPIQARPSTPWEKAVKWARRKPTAAALTGVSGSALLILLGVIVGFTLELQSALKETQGQRDRALKAEQAANAERDNAVREKDRADEQAAVAAAVNNFLQQDLLGQADSRQQADRRFTPDPDLKVRTLLDRAAKGIGERFQDKPVVAAAIREAIGQAYQGVGEYETAIQHLSAARGLRTTYLGADHPHTLRSMNNLAVAYREASRWADAVQLLEQLTQKLSPDDPHLLVTLNNLALAYRNAGRIDQAIRLYEQAREKFTQKLGPNDRRTLITLSNLANAYGSADQPAKALPLLEQVREKFTQTLGPEHPDTLTALHNLAEAYRDAGRIEEAIRLYEQLRDQSTRTLGPNHPDTLATLNNLATAYLDAGRTADAIALYEQLHKQLMQKPGPDHPSTLTAIHNLASAYRAAGRTAEAITLYEQTLAKRKEKLGPDHPDTLTSMNNLAGAYQAAGQLDKAVKLFEQTLAKLKEKQGPGHPGTLTSMNNLADAYQKNGDFAKAERILRECLTIRQQKQPDAWGTFATQSQLGGSLLGQKKYTDAGPLLLAGYEGMKQREAKIPATAKKYLTEALERLVQLYDAWGKPEQAKAWRQKLEQAKTPTKGPNK
jgi:serine/threonine protein kinase/DNA-binding SARP family transcriptional activator